MRVTTREGWYKCRSLPQIPAASYVLSVRMSASKDIRWTQSLAAAASAVQKMLQKALHVYITNFHGVVVAECQKLQQISYG